MGGGADQCIGIGKYLAFGGWLRCKHHACQIFEIYLMTDAHTWWHGGEVMERRLPPLQEGIALAVSLKLQCGVQVIRSLSAKLIYLHGVVDDQFRRLQWI